MPKNLLTGGRFQSPDGTILANGYLDFELSHDEKETDTGGQVVAGLHVRVPLDNNGSIAGTPSIWPNDILTPSGSYYIIMAYTKNDVKAWKSPQTQTVPSSPSPFDIGTWVPNTPPPV